MEKKNIFFAGVLLFISNFWIAPLKAQEIQAGKEDFSTFILELRQEAIAQGFNQDIVYKSLPLGMELNEKVLKNLVRQPESTFSFPKYFKHMVSPTRVKNGRKLLAEHRNELTPIANRYGIPPQVIVALWGIESAYGKLPGKWDSVASLATLAHSSHRKEFFRKELMAALKILNEGHIAPEAMKGSWAGAMGQCQFMPTSFLMYAADGNADGKKDIWHTTHDVFASAANYLKKHGWRTGEKWGQRVILNQILPPKLNFSERGLSAKKPMSYWENLGVSPLFKTTDPLPDSGEARLFLPEGPSKKAYLVYNNFNTILRWNNSSYFAFSVLMLADALGDGA